ncbi:tudor domain-containing 6-like [Drosophila obscura]|uniref:tudor domain-containing 6-like n=1 Tax=Drosophila obscura TaxID=7282 RepID=UPI001BB1FD6C|nr:tudor domain-containing 6-like [Drosophila obscura]
MCTAPFSSGSNSLRATTNTIWRGLQSQMSHFYSTDAAHRQPVLPLFLLPGYICAATSKWGGWRRVRIVAEPPDNATHVSVFYIDYGRLEKIACNDLRFLPKGFTDMPAMAVRGALARVHPPEYMWPCEATAMFRQQVMFEGSYAEIVGQDLHEAIYFVEIYETKKPGALSVNSLMIQTKLATDGTQFDERIENLCARRLRYVQERLPSFGMLETGVFPMDADREFEEYFKGIVCTPSFTMEFMVPATTNPFLQDLKRALFNWIVGFKKKQINQSRLEQKELEQAIKARAIEGANEQEELQMGKVQGELQKAKQQEEPEKAKEQEEPEKAKEQEAQQKAKEQEAQQKAKQQEALQKAKQREEMYKAKEHMELDKEKKILLDMAFAQLHSKRTFLDAIRATKPDNDN